MRVLVLFVRHGTERYPNGLTELDQFYRSQLPGVQAERVIIDNSLDPGLELRLDETSTLIGASNSHWEFSAWDDGLSYIGPQLDDFDLVHLITDAFRTLYVRYLERFSERMLAPIIEERAVVGHIDYFNEPVKLGGTPSQSWVRTACLFVPPAELQRLGSLVGIANPDRFFSGDPERPFRDDAPLSENFRRFITDWLTGADTGQGVKWHSAFEPTAERLPIFHAKALAILNEHSLSLRLRDQGCALVDAIWLSSHLPRLWLVRKRRTSFPSWDAQLLQRDVDAPRSIRAVS